ncbi:MAG TPA: hypothetical protein VIW21_13515, partial [Chthoniobacterales bacterium]
QEAEENDENPAKPLHATTSGNHNRSARSCNIVVHAALKEPGACQPAGRLALQSGRKNLSSIASGMVVVAQW